MGVFDDKEYDKLDWISQAVEPIKNPINTTLAKLPDELVVDFNMYHSFNENDYSVGLDLGDTVVVLASMYGQAISSNDKSLLSSCFQFEVSDNAEIDFENKRINGTIKLIKVCKQIDEKQLQENLGSKGLYDMRRMISYRSEENDVTRVNDMIEILDASHECRLSRSLKKKLKGIEHLMADIMKSNKWNIKDAGLADRFCTWVGLYLSTGNLAAYTNICRLKLMTHRGVAIYSMAEDKT